MPSSFDEVVKPPFLKGIDLTQDSRISNPGAWKELRNLYAESPGVISVRPGSAVMASEITAPGRAAVSNQGFDVIGSSLRKYGFTTVSGKAGLSNLDAMRDSIPAVSTHRGINPLWPRFIASSIGLSTDFPTKNVNNKNAGGEYINGITNAYVPSLNKSVWFGATHRGGNDTDYLWWFDEVNAKMRAIPLIEGHISGSADDWTFLPISSNRGYSNHTKQILTEGLVCIATNGVGRPLGIYYYGDTPNDPYEVRALTIRTNGNVDGLGDLKDFDVVNIQALCQYGGQVTIGGFGLYKETTDTYHDFSNCVTWIDRDSANGGMLINNNASTDSNEYAFRLTDDSTHFYYIRPGADLSERIRGLAPIASLIDTQGITGALAIFTDKKVAIYTNPPPTGGNPNGQDFHVTAMGDFGCCAPKSIVRTPDGVIFLATDGLFRLIGPDNTIMPISRAIAPIFRGLSPRFFRKVCAYYDGEFYKVFYPEKPRNAGRNIYTQAIFSVLPSANTLHLYADLRYIRAAPDRGVMWYGPHDGLNVSCVYRTNDMENFGTVMAGTGHTVALLQLDRYDLRTDPAMNNIAAATRRFDWLAVSGDYDGGDMHVDKTITALRVGLRTNADINMLMGITAFAPAGALPGAVYQTTAAIVATGTAASPGPIANGVEPYQSAQSLTMPVAIPPEGIRGRMFEFQFAERTPTNNARPIFSDIELTIKRHDGRRSTGIPT